MRKLKVILFSNLFPNKIEPDRGIYTFQIVQHLKKMCDLTVISPLPFFPKIFNLKILEKWWLYSQVPFFEKNNDIDVYYPKFFMIPKIGDYISYFTMFLRFYFFLKFKSADLKPDVINAQWAYPDGVAAAMAGRIFGIPVVISLLGSDINRDLQNGYFRKLIITSLHTCQKVITVSDELRDVVANYGIPKEKISVIYNGVDSDKFYPQDKSTCRKDLGLNNNTKFILFVGRLEPVKGVDVLIKAFDEYRGKMCDVKVILVGDGSLKSSLEADIQRRNLSDLFLFTGAQHHDTIAKWIGASDVFCLPSLNEGHPNVVMEAISCGRPVVASDVGAIARFVSQNVGFVFPPGNSNKLGELLHKSLSTAWNPDIIRQSISGMAWDANAKEYLTQFEKIIINKNNVI